MVDRASQQTFPEDGKDVSRVSLFIATLWSIWLNRNKSVFQGKEVQPQGLVEDVKRIHGGQIKHRQLMMQQNGLDVLDKSEKICSSGQKEELLVRRSRRWSLMELGRESEKG